jgi:hypothetical protein
MNDGGDAIIRAELDRVQLRSEECLALYRLLRAQGELRRQTLVEYRCASGRGCLLARVFNTPRGPFVFQPAYRYSQAAADRRTRSGQREWPERASELPQPPLAIHTICDHTHGGLDASTVWDDLETVLRTPARRPTRRRVRSAEGA